MNAVNALGEMMIACRHGNFPVKKGDKIAGTRIIPLVIEKEKMERAKKLAGEEPIFELIPFKKMKAAIVNTGNEVFYGRIKDTFTPVIIEKLKEYGAEVVGHVVSDDNHEHITAAIQKFLDEGVDMVLCTGGMSVDPDDRTPLAIKNTGAEIVTYGAPVLPGAMFLLSYYREEIPIVGLPGCVMYAKRTIFDLALPRLLADDEITAEELAALGEGGLCLNCSVCTYLEKDGNRKMLDRYGRVINYLRISVTDRCNLRCCYCMPEGVQDVGMKNILTFEEIWEIVRTGVSLGITHIRITGGEPLVRKGCVNLIRGIREIPGVETITMTTNGVLLGNYAKQLKEAGVDGVNISLDTLDPEEFYKITGKRELQEVLAGIRAAKTAGLPVKLNAVNRKELDPIPLVRYAQEENLPIRFIEMMPVGYGKKYVGRSNEELRETLEAVCGNAECMTNREELSRMGSGPAVYYQFSDLKVPVGFISAIHGKFCDTCNRVRLTAEGYLKLCLCYDEGEDLRRVLREGEKENLRTIMEQTIFRKPAAHCFEHPAEMTETHEMVKIGG